MISARSIPFLQKIQQKTRENGKDKAFSDAIQHQGDQNARARELVSAPYGKKDRKEDHLHKDDR